MSYAQNASAYEAARATPLSEIGQIHHQANTIAAHTDRVVSRLDAILDRLRICPPRPIGASTAEVNDAGRRRPLADVLERTDACLCHAQELLNEIETFLG